MNEMTKGEIMRRCFEYSSHCAQEIENVADCFKNEFSKWFEKDGKFLRLVLAGDWIESSREDDSGWLYSDVGWSLPLKRRGKGRQPASAWLTVQFSLWGEGLLPGLGEPVVHVYCFDGPCNFDLMGDYCYVGFPLDSEDDDLGNDQVEIEIERRLLWKMGGEHWQHQWCYSVLLTALSNPGDIKRLVVDPSVRLLSGSSVVDALPDELFSEGLLRYPERRRLFEPRS